MKKYNNKETKDYEEVIKLQVGDAYEIHTNEETLYALLNISVADIDENAERNAFGDFTDIDYQQSYIGKGYNVIS